MDIDSIEPAQNIKTLIWPVDSFGRSVNLKLDLGNTSDVTTFHFTEKSFRLLDELLDACDDGNRDRAFSVIGPYGSGKSLFGLLVSTVFSKETSSWSEKTLAQLEDENPELSRKLRSVLEATELGFFPIIVQGEKGPFDLALCNALFEALTSEDRVTDWVPSKLTQSIHITMETIKSGINRSSDVVELYRQASDHARASGYRGLIVVADEFGKFLERGATQGELPDLVASQYLAELARDSRDAQILFMVLVHQSFQDYASTLSQDQRLEWSKVQGRFRQIDFSDQSEDLYELIASCLSRNISDESSDKQIEAWADRIVTQVQGIPLFQGDVKHAFWSDFLPTVYPFHPIALYGLPRLSARLGQNERTLFTFLISEDPLGLKRFLSETFIDKTELPSLTFDVVVDFFLYSARFSSWSPDIRQSVSELESALERLGDRPELETRLIKTIGGIKLLRVGPVLPNTKSTLIATLGLDAEDGDALVTSALDELVSRKIVVHRRFSDEYHLWEGSDFDFDESIANTREEIKNGIDVSLTLPSQFLSRQLIAHKHGLMTGNTRSFPRVFRSVEECRSLNVDELLASKMGRVSAGLIIHCSPSTMAEVGYLKEWASAITDERVLITIPEVPSDALSLVIDLAALKKIRDENPEIGEDPVALKELSSREQGLADLLEGALIEVMEPGPCGPTWYWQGEAHEINDSKTMNQLLSYICDHLYPKAPRIHNELINRYQISGAVVTAVKKIAAELLSGSDEERLGLEGNGPEVSIFKAVYEKTGIYRRSGDDWRLHDPEETNDSNIGPTWTAITEYIQSCNRTSKPLSDLFLELQNRPYGVRAAMVRLLVWTVLIRNRDSICLYYDGTFIPEWDVESFELSSRVPEKFTIRYLVSESATRTVVAGLARTLGISRGTVGVNTLLNALFNWYRNLPEFAKRTTHISEEAKGLRDAITTSSDPIDLLFSQIPISLGLPSLIDNETGAIPGRLPRIRTKTLADKFDQAFHEIESSYSELHDGMVQVLSEEFGCENTIPALQHWVKTTNAALDGYIRDIQTKAFMNRAVDGSDRDPGSWLESLGATLTNQSPRQWPDWYLDEFREKVALVSQSVEDAHRRKFALGDNALTEGAVRLVVESTDELLLDRIIDLEEESPDVVNIVNWIRTITGDRGTEYDKDRVRRLLAQALVYTLAEDNRRGG